MFTLISKETDTNVTQDNNLEVFNTIHVEKQNDWFNEMKFSKHDFVPAIACVPKKKSKFDGWQTLQLYTKAMEALVKFPKHLKA